MNVIYYIAIFTELFINTTNKDFVFSSHVTDYVDREGAVQAFLQSNQLINQGNG